ncbi:hypothetical protein B0H14DRAFT_2596462 [Mycena olivaceomarginata]|nr:hypothetical protein B0H14DRAFT_2596462 [Mycena olivaceomarginata]
MPDVFVHPDLAVSFVAYMNTQGESLPPSFSELSSRLSAALAAPTASPAASFSQPMHSLQASSASAAQAARATVPLPRRAVEPQRMHSFPPEDGQGREDFLAGAPAPATGAAGVQMAQLSPLSMPTSSPNHHGSPLGSSPTLQGDNTPPLRDSETPVGLPSTPTLGKRGVTCLDKDADGSPSTPTLGKRVVTCLDEDADDSKRGLSELVGPGLGSSSTSLGVELLLVEGEEAGMGEVQEGGGPDCAHRGDGDAAHSGSAADIGQMPCNQAGCSHCDGEEGEEEGEELGGDGGQDADRGLQGWGKNNTQGG